MKTLMMIALASLALSFNPPSKTVHDFTVTDIDGKEVKLDAYAGKTLLIVNVASRCGLTPQYEDLQNLYEKYKDQGLVILGFPANNFMGQEPGTDAEIKQFCTSKFQVSFPMFSKISVKGKDQHPLYSYLTNKEENGSVDAPVKWNFQKFLVDKDGKVVQSFAPRTKVTEQEVIDAIEAQL